MRRGYFSQMKVGAGVVSESGRKIGIVRMRFVDGTTVELYCVLPPTRSLVGRAKSWTWA